MKAPAFDYAVAKSLSEAISLLVEHGEDAKLLAGGQSLIPSLNLRLSAPKILIDIGNIHALKEVSFHAGTLRIGALTSHNQLIQSPLIQHHAPLLSQAATHIAHAAIRNRGTIGGSLANADPAAELPACLMALQAQIIVHGPIGERQIAAEAFFTGIYETALQSNEIITAVLVPMLLPNQRTAFAEFARRNGDYAMVGLACRLTETNERIQDVRLVFFAVADRPIIAKNTGKILMTAASSPHLLAQAQDVLDQDIAPFADLQASLATRLQLARVLLSRVLTQLVPALAQDRLSA